MEPSLPSGNVPSAETNTLETLATFQASNTTGLSNPSAQVAEEFMSMLPPNELDTVYTQVDAVAPKYADREREILHRFLAWQLAKARHNLQKIRDFAGDNRDHPLFAGQIRYWFDTVSAINWLATHVNYKQQHLLLGDIEPIMEQIQQWQSQRPTSQKPEPSDNSASGITEA